MPISDSDFHNKDNIYHRKPMVVKAIQVPFVKDKQYQDFFGQHIKPFIIRGAWTVNQDKNNITELELRTRFEDNSTKIVKLNICPKRWLCVEPNGLVYALSDYEFKQLFESRN